MIDTEFRLEVGKRYKDGTSGELGTCTRYDSSDNTFEVVGDESGAGWYHSNGRNTTFPDDDSTAVYPLD